MWWQRECGEGTAGGERESWYARTRVRRLHQVKYGYPSDKTKQCQSFKYTVTKCVLKLYVDFYHLLVGVL